jgi:hypothetical protein
METVSSSPVLRAMHEDMDAALEQVTALTGRLDVDAGMIRARLLVAMKVAKDLSDVVPALMVSPDHEVYAKTLESIGHTEFLFEGFTSVLKFARDVLTVQGSKCSALATSQVCISPFVPWALHQGFLRLSKVYTGTLTLTSHATGIGFLVVVREWALTEAWTGEPLVDLAPDVRVAIQAHVDGMCFCPSVPGYMTVSCAVFVAPAPVMPCY